MLCWAYNFVAIKELYPHMSAPALSLARFALMFVILLGICVVVKEPLTLPKEHRGRILWSGFISMGVYMILFLEGMRLTTASEGAIVLATAPIFTYLLACVAKQERFSIPALIAGIVAFCGVAMVILGGAGITGNQHGTLLGNIVILISALVWAVAVVIMRPVLTDVSPIRVLTLGMPAGLIALLPYGIPGLLRTDFTRITPYGWLMFLHIAVLSGVVAFAFYYMGIKKIGAGGATLYQFFVPPTTAFFAWLSLGERLNIWQGLGLLVILFGVWTSFKARAAAQQRA